MKVQEFTVRNTVSIEASYKMLDTIKLCVLNGRIEKAEKEHPSFTDTYNKNEGMLYPLPMTDYEKAYNKFAVSVAEKVRLEEKGTLKIDDLNDYDSMMAIIMAHKSDKSIFVTFDDDTVSRLVTVANDFYKTGLVGSLRDNLRSIINHLNAYGEGEYFAPVAVKRSEVSDENARHFFATFSKGAKRDNKARSFAYAVSDNAKRVNKALTDLLAVII